MVAAAQHDDCRQCVFVPLSNSFSTVRQINVCVRVPHRPNLRSAIMGHISKSFNKRSSTFQAIANNSKHTRKQQPIYCFGGYQACHMQCRWYNYSRCHGVIWNHVGKIFWFYDCKSLCMYTIYDCDSWLEANGRRGKFICHMCDNIALLLLSYRGCCTFRSITIDW